MNSSKKSSFDSSKKTWTSVFVKNVSDVEVEENEFLHIWLVGKRIVMGENNKSFLWRAYDLKVIVGFIS